MKAHNNFIRLESGILNIIRAADLYLIHVISKYRKEQPNKDLIEAIMSRNNISGFNVIGWTYQDNEFEYLEQHGHVREIGQQIILSTYSALESYLIDKFKEFIEFKLAGIDPKVSQNIIKQIYIRSIDDIKNNYFDYLEIHLPSYDIEFYSDEKSSFQAKDSWSAIILLTKARNEIAHKGVSENYKVTTLLDAWYPFDFVRNWVSFFDDAFDRVVYNNSTKYLPKSYLANLARLKDI